MTLPIFRLDHRRFALALAVVVLTSSGVLSAQSSVAPPPARSPQATIKAVVENSAAFFRANDVMHAEAQIAQLNISPAGTSAWNAEFGHRLIEVALNLETLHQGVAARVAASRALAYLDTAQAGYQREGNLQQKANALSNEAFVREFFFSDYQTALSYQQQALKLNPKATHSRREVYRLSHLLSLVQAAK